MIPRPFIDDVISSSDIVAVIGDYVPLKPPRFGGFEYSGRCPFHNDSRPSLSVNQNKGLYVCRACGASGNVVTFLEKHAGMGFLEWIENLADRLGMKLPDDSSGNTAAGNHSMIYDALERATQVYRKAFIESPTAVAYAESRGVDSKTAERFMIGYAPGGTAPRLIAEALSEIPLETLEKAGLIAKPEAGKPARDWFYNRLIFPIRNTQGRVVGFGGRSLSKDSKRKYLNSPDSPVFKKSRELYGMFENSAAIRKSNEAVVVEGYHDVVVTSGHGFDNAVSLMGTACNQMNTMRLFRAADRVVYCMDPDASGRTAALRAMENALPFLEPGKETAFMFLPEAMDPDEYVLKNGAQALNNLAKTAEPLSKYMIRELSERHGTQSVESRAKLAKDAMDMINTICSPVLRSFMEDELRRVVGGDVVLPVPQNNAGPKIETPLELTMGMRVLSKILRAPYAAPHFESSWLQNTRINDAELETIEALLREARTLPEENAKASVLLSRFANTPYEKILAAACAMDESGIEGIDHVQDLAAIAQFLQRQHHKLQLVKGDPSTKTCKVVSEI